MTTEINSLVSSLRTLNQELSGGAMSRAHRAKEGVGREPMGGAGDAVAYGVEASQQEAKAGAAEEGGIEGTVSELNALAQRMHRELQFTIEKDSGEMVVKVIDKETNEVIRQIPPEVIMELRKRLEDAAGVIFRDSV